MSKSGIVWMTCTPSQSMCQRFILLCVEQLNREKKLEESDHETRNSFINWKQWKWAIISIENSNLSQFFCPFHKKWDLFHTCVSKSLYIRLPFFFSCHRILEMENEYKWYVLTIKSNVALFLVNQEIRFHLKWTWKREYCEY